MESSSQEQRKSEDKTVSKRKLAISDPKYLDHYDLDNKNTFVITDQMNTITKQLECGVSIIGISKAYMVLYVVSIGG